jgi:hypothetical protein
MTNQIQQWLASMADYLIKSWGLAVDFADDAALLYLYFHVYGLSPTITSGYRSPDKQAELRARYAAGDKSVIVKPAANSKHTITLPDGTPASEAIDISTSNHPLAANISRALGVGAGYYFSTPDYVHFYQI